MNDWKLYDNIGTNVVVSNGTVASFNYTCDDPSDCTYYYSKLPPGYYKLEVWGAQGGGGSYGNTFHSCDVYGGYSVAVNDNEDSRVIVAGGAGGCSYQAAAFSDQYPLGWGGGEIAGFCGRGTNKHLQATSTSGYKKLFGQNGIYVPGAVDGAGGGGYYGGFARNGGYHYNGGGGSGFIGGVISYKDIQKKSIPGNEEIYLINGQKRIGNPGNEAARITLLGYNLVLKTTLKDYYEPDSRIYLNFSLNSIGTEEQAKIKRSINDQNEVLFKTIPDEGKEMNFEDDFLLPSTPGKYDVKYIVESKSGSMSEPLIVKILVTNAPKIEIFGNPKTKYMINENASVIIDVSDDTYVNLYIFDELQTYKTLKVICNNNKNRTKVQFTIPNTEQYKIGSKHMLTIYAMDEFGIRSDPFDTEFTIVENRSPDINIVENVTYLVNSYMPLLIKGQVRDHEIPSRNCLITSIDEKYEFEHQCMNMTTTDWVPFSIKRSVASLRFGIHDISVFSIDEYQSQSNTYNFSFAFSPDFVFKDNITCLADMMIFRKLILILTTNIFM